MNLTNFSVFEAMTTQKGFARAILTAAVATSAISLPIMSAIPASAATAPQCILVTRYETKGATHHLTLRNTCKTSERVKVITAFGRDFNCTSIDPGWEQRYKWNIFRGDFDRVDRC